MDAQLTLVQLDKFDNQRHFEHKVPMIAKTTPHLRNSILALCARQIERKENSKSSSESLGLYQEAIHLLLPELETKDTAVIASCVILCVLEMMSCKFGILENLTLLIIQAHRKNGDGISKAARIC